MRTNNLYSIFKTKFCLVSIILFSVTMNSLNAQNASYSTIKLLYVNSVRVDNAAVDIFPPPGKGKKSAQVQTGTVLYSGTEMIIPDHVKIIVKSPGGTQTLESSAGKKYTYTINFTAEGENHVIKDAKMQSEVPPRIAYNYRVTTAGGTTCAVKGTEFTFIDESEGKTEKASITTKTGAVIIIDKVPVSINHELLKTKQGNPVTKSASYTQSAGSATFVSSNKAIEYNSVEDCIKLIQQEINAETDPEDLADDLMCLGDLYMNKNMPKNAIVPFRRAAAYLEKMYGPEEMETIEAKLSLADALIETADPSNTEEGKEIVSQNIKILQRELAESIEDYKDETDTEDKEFICEDLKEFYEYLEWAYHLLGNEAKSEEYKKKSDSDCG